MAFSRSLFFFAYAILAAILFLVRLEYVFRDPRLKDIVYNYCNDLEIMVVYAGTHNTGWAISEYASYMDCLSQMGSDVWKEEAVFLLVVAAIQTYFSIVLWTHAKEVLVIKPKMKGRKKQLPHLDSDASDDNSEGEKSHKDEENEEDCDLITRNKSSTRNATHLNSCNDKIELSLTAKE